MIGVDSDASALDLGRVSSLKRSEFDRAGAQKIFGTPAAIDLGLSTSSSGEEIWDYRQGSFPRLSIFFATNSSFANGMTWFVRDGDKEQDLRTAMGYFPTAKWSLRPLIVSNPHDVPDECVFEDRNLGIAIEFRGARREVGSIVWWDPKRVLAKEKKPQKSTFCIGEQCSTGFPRKWEAERAHCQIP